MRRTVAVCPVLALAVTFAACSTGESTGDSFGGPALPTTASASGTGAQSTDSAGATGDATTDAAPTSTSTAGESDGSATESDSAAATSTGEAPTTGAVDDTDDSGDTEGCPPGTLNCPCDQGGCGAELICEEGVCAEDTGPQCVDDLLVNDTQSTASYQGDLQEGEFDMTSGVLLDPDDSDWLMFHGTDTLLLEAQPVFDVLEGGGVVMCVFIDCDNGEQANPSCPPGTSQTSSTLGDPGCCSSNSVGFDLNEYTCTANPLGDDSADFYISVTPTSECVDFTVFFAY